MSSKKKLILSTDWRSNIPLKLEKNFYMRLFRLRLLFFIVLATFVSQLSALPFWENDNFDWKNSKSSYGGVMRTTKIDTQNPRPIKLNAVRLELAKVSPILTKKDKDFGKPMPDYPQHTIRTKRQTTREFVENLLSENKQLKIVFACNTSPWRPWTRPYTHTYADYRGYIVSDGDVISTGFVNENDLFPILYWDKQGQIGITTPSANENLAPYKHAIFAFSLLLKDGVSYNDMPIQKGLATHSDFQKLYPTINKILFPSIAIGFDKDKKYLYIVGVDGRQPKISEGIYAKEMAKIIKYFGAHNAVLMDGGGSTTLLCVDENTKQISRLNTHPKKNVERKVGFNLAFELKE